MDIYPEKAEEKKARHGLTDARVYESHRQMLESEPNVDIVDVCTPPYVHAEIGIDALNAGCHVLCAKNRWPPRWRSATR